MGWANVPVQVEISSTVTRQIKYTTMTPRRGEHQYCVRNSIFCQVKGDKNGREPVLQAGSH